MNNNYLNNLINLYGGNENSNEYTSSLLNKYTNKNKDDIVIIKLDNLETLLYDEELDDNMFDIFNNNNIVEIDNNNNDNIEIDNLYKKYQDAENSETFSEIVSKIIK